MNDGSTSHALVGRGDECALLEQLPRKAGAGHNAVLVVRGAPGIGKTALLDRAARLASHCHTVRVRAVAAEAELPYSTLHLLCSALAAELPGLAEHQRDALETAIGLRAGPATDRFIVGVATAALLAMAAATQPLFCIVDDIQWLDAASADVLAFVARRLDAVPVALLLAGRGNGFPGLPDLVLDGLGDADARRLLESHLPAAVDENVLERIVAEARGNPRVLLDAARRVSPVELAGGYGLVGGNAAVHVDLARLTPDSRLLLLLAAAEPLGDPARVWRAAAALGIAADAADQLEVEELVSFGSWVTFRDPQLRWAVYGRASAAQRRRVHAALAAATDRAADPDRHAWHLAHALQGPDDTVAEALADTAETARGRGGLPAEAAFLERAALCTTKSAPRVERTIAAAETYRSIGAVDAATRLLARAERGPVDAVSGARLRQVWARMAFDATRSRAAVAQLLDSAEDLARCAPRHARTAYLEALGAAIFTGHVDVVRTALTRLAGSRSQRTDRLLEGLAQRCTNGYAAGVEPLKLALKTLDNDHAVDSGSRLLGCLIAPDLWDDDRWDELTGAEVERVRNAGARAVLPYVLTHRALVEIHIGRFDTARSLVEEARALTDAAGVPPFPHADRVLAAWRGRRNPELESGEPDGAGMVAATQGYATAVLCNGLGAYGDAVAVTRGVLDREALELQGWSLAELVEGAVRSGELATASDALERLSERAWLSGTDWALGVEARSRALLQDGRAAEDLYAEAIGRLERSRIRTDLARTQLVYGEWLRRQARRVDARAPLRAAHDAFVEMGAEAFATRAMRELLATGERPRRRTPATRAPLTEQEVRIAALARDGRSNPEIATVLSISPRTVEYHLHKVFTKLAIRSRTELHLVLTGDERA
ncbi:helix-turn-helix transcriptional regulator [Pseudonocardia zijingensis]|uniref:LuxR family transcriptional regulator n=1 Tax=Pseudonocardia zijingensis TaxID=153376 RepID=A0ABP3YX42_9PSEU